MVCGMDITGVQHLVLSTFSMFQCHAAPASVIRCIRSEVFPKDLHVSMQLEQVSKHLKPTVLSAMPVSLKCHLEAFINLKDDGTFSAEHERKHIDCHHYSLRRHWLRKANAENTSAMSKLYCDS